jgi:hypothetical protein
VLTPSETFLEIDLIADFGYSAANPCAGTIGCVTTFRGHASGSFGATGTLVDAQLFDAGGSELDPSLIQSESGFRYDLVGVPEPSVIALAATGMLVAVGRRHRD